MAAPKEDDDVKAGVDDVPDETDGYKVAEKATLEDLMNKDKGDESLRKYKEQLLAGAKNSIIDANDKRQVFFDMLVIEPEGRDPIEINPAKCDPNQLAFTLKEKSKYRVVIKFRVQREIVLGLKKFVVIKRKGIPIEKSTEMMGSFGPDAKKTYEHPFPWEIVPDGMLARGTYSCKTQFLDDDKAVHLSFSYSFKIAKDW